MFSFLLLLIIGGVSAEDISGDSSEVEFSCEIQQDISSSDVVSSDYLADSEVSQQSEISENVNDDVVDEIEPVGSIDNFDMSNNYDYSPSMEVKSVNPTTDVVEDEFVSIDNSISSISQEEEDMKVNVVNISIKDDNVNLNSKDDCLKVQKIEFDNTKLISCDYCIVTIIHDSISEIDSIDVPYEFNVLVSNPDLIIQSIQVENNGLIKLNLTNVNYYAEASESNKLGRDVTARENKLFNFRSVDSVFVITTEGILKLNSRTNEPVIEGIFDNIEYVSHDMDKEIYVGTESVINSDGKNVFNVVDTENVLFVSLIEGFDESISLDVLQEAVFHSKICKETYSGYTISKELLQYYPPTNKNGQTDKGNIVMDKDSNILGSINNEDEQNLKISNSNFDGLDLCNPLWFNFILKQSDGSLMSIYMRYNEDNFFIEDYNRTQTYNLISTLYGSAFSSGIVKSAYPDEIDEAIAADCQLSNQDLSNYATSESEGYTLKLENSSDDLISQVESDVIDGVTLSSFDDIDNEDLLESIAMNIEKDNTKTNLSAKIKACNCSNCNHFKCNCSNCNCSKMNCSNLNGSNHCNCSHSKEGRKHHGHKYHGHYRKIIRYETVRGVIDKISGSYGMLDDNSTDENSTDDNVTVVGKGPISIPKPIKPTNFNTLIISLAGILGLGILFGISHRRQEN